MAEETEKPDVNLDTENEHEIDKASKEEIIGLMKGITTVAKKLGISINNKGDGYRTLTNIGNHGGQEVPHLHFHIFGGEKVGRMVQ